MSDVVLFELIQCKNEKQIGVITLNSERSLNALSHEMVNKIYPQLVQWQNDSKIVAVFLQGAGEKALCAGGDIVYLYKSLPEVNGDSAPQIQRFFCDEYKLDHLIHTYTKPFIVWGNGIVMGGGLGLMAGGSHRIVTQNTRIAMPEISIGLYPDVGGSYFLNKMPDNSGLFLGLTGASINAADSLYTNLADHYINHELKLDFITKLMLTEWSKDDIENKKIVSAVLTRIESQNKVLLPTSNVERYAAEINQITNYETLNEIVDALSEAKIENKWFMRAQSALNKGSALSAAITHKLLKKTKQYTLEECFQLEFIISTRCSEFGEFKEGVRALLIDKDNQPAWRYENSRAVDESVLEWFFTSPWQKNEHPLLNLGR